MNNKYIALTSMYRYGILYMADKPTPEQIKHTITTTNPHTVIPGSKMLVKKALRDNYGVANKADMEQVIEELMYGVWMDSMVYAALIEVFLDKPAEFTDLSTEQVEAFLVDKNRLQTYQERYVSAWEFAEMEVDQVEFTANLKKAIQGYFSLEQRTLRTQLAEIFQKNKAWLSYTDQLSMAAFQFSRIISIIADSFLCGYIIEEETAQRLNYYGALAEQLFKSWESFLFSAILGKQLMSSASGTFIIDAKDYIENCYKLAVHPAKILAISGLWADSDLTRFCTCIEKEYDVSLAEAEVAVGESDPMLSFVETVVLPIFEKYGVEYLFDQDACQYSYTVPVADVTSLDFELINDDLKKVKFDYGADEIPFMLNGNKLLVTSKKIYVQEKKFFFFNKKTHVFNWSDKLHFSYKFGKLDDVLFMINEIVAFTLPRNYKKFGMGMMADSQLDKEEILERYGKDIENALLAFSELNEVLGKQ